MIFVGNYWNQPVRNGTRANKSCFLVCAPDKKILTKECGGGNTPSDAILGVYFYVGVFPEKTK